MGRRYVRITEDEFDEFMTELVPDHKVVIEPGTKEKTYELPLPSDDLSIRVYSTLKGGFGRDRGDDAIRCVIWSEDAHGPVGGRKKTLRIQTWRENLRGKIEDLYLNWRKYDHGRCPECSGVLVERVPGPNDEWGPFLACSNWNGGAGCDHTEPL